jgi:cytochrome c-type biogenesis protein CcmH
VSITPQLAKEVPAGAPLFVFVRDGEGAGPPLAVTRRNAAELPLTVELSDRDSMIPGRSLSNAARLTVVARVTRSGQPVARSGDLEGRLSYDVRTGSPTELIINSVVP